MLPNRLAGVAATALRRAASVQTARVVGRRVLSSSTGTSATATRSGARRSLALAVVAGSVATAATAMWLNENERRRSESALQVLARGAGGVLLAESSPATTATTETPLSPLAAAAAAAGVPRITLYQYEVCPFCCKVRAFLDYHRLPYEVVEVNPMTKGELKFSKEYKKVPVVVLERGEGDAAQREQMNDSSAIIDHLQAQLFPQLRAPTEEEQEWRRWVDARLVRLLPPNIYRNRDEALEAFSYITDHGKFSRVSREFARYAGATAMYFVARKKKKEYGITDERQALYEALNAWSTACTRDGRPFMGGAEPGLADLAVFGVLRSIKGLTAWKDAVANTPIEPWFERMEKAVGTTSRVA